MKKIFVIPNEQQALERMCARCAKSEQCESDVRRKLTEWKQPADTANRIVERLRANGFIDDNRYCRAFVEDKWKFNRWGKTKIRISLLQKGFDRQTADETLQLIDDNEYIETLSALLHEKNRTLHAASDYERYQKLFRFAAMRGFEPSAIKECITCTDDL